MLAPSSSASPGPGCSSEDSGTASDAQNASRRNRPTACGSVSIRSNASDHARYPASTTCTDANGSAHRRAHAHSVLPPVPRTRPPAPRGSRQRTAMPPHVGQVDGGRLLRTVPVNASAAAGVKVEHPLRSPGSRSLPGRRGCGLRRRGTRGRRPRVAGRRPGTPRGSTIRRGPTRRGGALIRAGWVP
jgi:hypothetical protein